MKQTALTLLLFLAFDAAAGESGIAFQPQNVPPETVRSLLAAFGKDKGSLLEKEKASENHLYLPFEHGQHQGLPILFGDLNHDGKADALVPFTWEGLSDIGGPGRDWYNYYAIYLQDKNGWKMSGKVLTSTSAAETLRTFDRIENGVIYGKITPRSAQGASGAPREWVLRSHPGKRDALIPLPVPARLAVPLVLDLDKEMPLTPDMLAIVLGKPVNIGNNYNLIGGDCAAHPDWKYYQYENAAFNVGLNGVGVSNFIGIPHNLTMTLGGMTITGKTSAYALISALSASYSFSVLRKSPTADSDPDPVSNYFDDARDIYAMNIPYYIQGYEAWAKLDDAAKENEDDRQASFTRQFYYTTEIDVTPPSDNGALLEFYFMGEKMVALQVVYNNDEPCD
ncbi:hypothetical protein [Enterobacillus tribolii]|uniref:VCBS repeat protein n=1 Tax=Enterobacillus tribolii TaxID=1487935 RepID=A0A370R3B8_9GAMM|nr:hypothetical protein [Enterobacillus tribolii]MBW7983972.1 hypothetical protein [Enterobacillus tribolii]RDK96911.1 hypothetical protein C8D90_101347 [Enterobacillus tribolii]